MALLTGDEIIEIAIGLEERGETFYTTAASQATTAEIRDLFEELALQEQYHREVFRKMGRDLVHLTLSDEQWDQFQSYAGALLRQRIFDNPDGALGDAAVARDEKQALQAAIGFEEETLRFFRDLRDVVRGGDRRAVDRIIGEEEQHIQRLSDMLAAR